MQTKYSYWVIGITALLLASCVEPCRQLAESICSCKDTPVAVENCKRTLDAQSQHKAFSRATDTEKCKEVLKNQSCNCQALERGDFHLCGMTRE